MEDAATLQQLLLLPGFGATLADDLNRASRYDRKIINHKPTAQQALHFQSVSHRRCILFPWHIKGDVILWGFFHYNKFLPLAFMKWNECDSEAYNVLHHSSQTNMYSEWPWHRFTWLIRLFTGLHLFCVPSYLCLALTSQISVFTRWDCRFLLIGLISRELVMNKMQRGTGQRGSTHTYKRLIGRVGGDGRGCC